MPKSLIVFLFFGILLVNSQISVSANTCCTDNQIEVSGQATVSALPDVAIVSIRFNENGTTSAQAVKALSAKVTQAISILKANNYPADSYETGALSVYPQYNYSSGKSVIVGQAASQSLTITAKGIDTKGQKVGVLVDALSQVNGINIDSVSFDIFNKTSLQTQARSAAFKNAQAKAQDYAGFAGLKLGRAVKIDDVEAIQAPVIRNFASAKLQAVADSGSSTSVPLGNYDITYRTTVTFQLR